MARFCAIFVFARFWLALLARFCAGFVLAILLSAFAPAAPLANPSAKFSGLNPR